MNAGTTMLTGATGITSVLVQAHIHLLMENAGGIFQA